MKKNFKLILIVSAIIFVISIIGTIATKNEYNARMEETGLQYKLGQYSYSSVYSDLNSFLALNKTLKMFYAFDVISGIAILGSAIGLKVVKNKEELQ
ncbi:MAG: hypothetical protein E7561_00955 [Ruminococcaceae bacterium]|nr:hypothetical protein [Oscillospiraceae bacterium]